MKERAYKKEILFALKVLLAILALVVLARLAWGISTRKNSGATGTENANVAAPTGIAGHSYMVANISTGEVYAEKNDTLAYPLASITKLMTAIVASNTLSMNSSLEMTPLILTTYGNENHFQYGEKLTVNQLFYFLLMESDNAVAETISMSTGSGENGGDAAFVKEMNAEARTLGLTSTSFADASGLSALDTASASDLLRLAQYITTSKPFIWQVTASPERTILDGGYVHLIQNANLFNADPRFVGGKIGYTPEAGETMIALFALPAKDAAAGKIATQTIAFIVLDSDSRDADIGKLLNWFEENYSK